MFSMTVMTFRETLESVILLTDDAYNWTHTDSYTTQTYRRETAFGYTALLITTAHRDREAHKYTHRQTDIDQWREHTDHTQHIPFTKVYLIMHSNYTTQTCHRYTVYLSSIHTLCLCFPGGPGLELGRYQNVSTLDFIGTKGDGGGAWWLLEL